MSIRIPPSLTVRSMDLSVQGGTARPAHGDVLLGMVTRAIAGGEASIKFAGFEARGLFGNLFQAGSQVFAGVQKSGGDTSLALILGVNEGEIVNGVVTRAGSSEAHVRFGEAEVRVRLPSTGNPAPSVGAQIRVQAQAMAGKGAFQMLPADLSDQNISGTVMSQRADGRVLFDVGGAVLMATTAENLEAGDRVQARMLRANNKVTLQILQKIAGGGETASPSGRPVGSLESFLAMPKYARLLDALVSGDLKLDATIRELLLLLQQLTKEAGRTEWALTLEGVLQALLLDPEGERLGQQLAGALRNSGVFLESRMLKASLSTAPDGSLVGDLKLALLAASQKLSQMLEAASSEGREAPRFLAGLATGVERLLDALTALQLQNLRAVPSQELYIQIPFAEGAGIEHMELQISHHGKRDSRKIDARNLVLTLAVKTSKLGRIRSSISIVEGQISCQFRAESESVVELLNNSADMLRRGFEKLDYRVAHIGCTLCWDERELSVFDTVPNIDKGGLDVHV